MVSFAVAYQADDVTCAGVRRTVAVHAMLAFVFNTVILGAVISALLG